MASIHIRLIILFVIGFLCQLSYTSGQTPISIKVLSDDDVGREEFVNNIKQEISTLLGEGYQVIYDDIIIAGANGFDKTISDVYSSDADIVLSTGVFSSVLLSQLDQYPKPTIAGLLTDDYMGQESSEVDNYTYIIRPFSFEDDVATFLEITDFDNMAILAPQHSASIIEGLMNPAEQRFGINIEVIPSSHTLETDFSQLDESVDAMYIFPYDLYGENTNKLIADRLIERKTPSFSLFGKEAVQEGALAGRSNATFMQNYSRRIAINILRILDGENPSTFPLDLTIQESDLLINMKTAQLIEVYPTFEVLSEAELIDVDYIPDGATPLTLESSVLIALENNLEIQIAERNVELQENTVKSTKSNLYPNLGVGAGATLLDDQSANAGTNDELSVTGNLSLSQVILSEPLYASIAIQKTLQKVEQEALRQKQLDIVQSTADVYLNYLLARANLKAQQSNVEVTRKNLNLAKTKENIGSANAADKYRFEAELASNSVAYNEALKNLDLAGYSLALLLNRPKTEQFDAADIDIEIAPVIFAQPGIQQFVSNQDEAQKLGDFLVEYALEHQPNIRQIGYNLDAQERSLKSSKRSLYLPQLNLSGGLNQTLGRFGDITPSETLQNFGIDPWEPTWNVGLNASLPIFQGFARRADIQRNKISINQLGEQQDLTQQSNETIIRSDLINLSNTFGDVLLNEKSLDAAQSYLTIIQDLYQQGVSNIATLLDAQNNALNTELGLINARYQLVRDAVTLERDIGFMFLLSDEEQKAEFIQAFQEYMIKQ